MSPNALTFPSVGETALANLSGPTLTDLILRDYSRVALLLAVGRVQADARVAVGATLTHGVWTRPLRVVLSARGSRALGVRERSAHSELTTGAVTSPHGLLQWGYEVDVACPLCGRLDTLVHRLLLCSDQRVLACRSQLSAEPLARWAAVASVSPSSDSPFALATPRAAPLRLSL